MRSPRPPAATPLSRPRTQEKSTKKGVRLGFREFSAKLIEPAPIAHARFRNHRGQSIERIHVDRLRIYPLLVGVLLMLVEHTADANAGTDDSVHESKGIAHDHEFARTTDLPGPTDCRMGFESEGAPPNLSHNPVGSDLAEIGVEILDSQQVAAGARGPLKPLSCWHVWRVALLRL